MKQTAIVAPPSLKEALEQLDVHGKDYYVSRQSKRVFHPVNCGFSVNENLLRTTRNTLSSLVVELPLVGTDKTGLVQVKRISMPHKGETLGDYLSRIDSILKNLDDHAKFFEL